MSENRENIEREMKKGAITMKIKNNIRGYIAGVGAVGEIFGGRFDLLIRRSLSGGFGFSEGSGSTTFGVSRVVVICGFFVNFITFGFENKF